MPRTEKVDLKQELSQQADKLQTPSEETVKLKRNMSIPEMVKALTPEKGITISDYTRAVYTYCP